MPKRLRKDIQALRAIAVGLVLLNHLWPGRVTGGYVGVDVFFVISGFLITAHLLGEMTRTGTVALPRFYARRARRLLPAALLVTLASLAGTVLLLPAERWERIGRELFAASAYFENWLLASSAVDYFEQGQSATPVQHYWSLSVEEQFYLVWPIMLLALGWWVSQLRRSPAHRPSNRSAGSAGSIRASRFSERQPQLHVRSGALLLTLTALGVASFSFAVWSTGVERNAAYFNTFGRAWEFLLGALLAVAAPALGIWFERHASSGLVQTLRGCAQLAGYGLIAYAALTFTAATLFPGPWALMPAIGTAVVIAAGPTIPKWSPARLLEWRPIQYTGDISYSLYLWHWPLIVFAPFAISRDLGALDRVVILALSVGLAGLTKRFVEDPGRTRMFADARPRRSLLAALVSIAVVGLLTAGTGAWARAVQDENAALLATLSASECFGAGALTSEAGCPEPFGKALLQPQGEQNAPWSVSPPECQSAPEDRQILADGKPSRVECDFHAATVSESGTPAEPKNVWLVGDSHAEHWRPAVLQLAEANGWRLTSTMQGGCPVEPLPLESFQGAPTSDEKRENCLSWGTAVSRGLLQDHPDLVIVATFASAETVNDGSGRPQADQLASGFNGGIGAWADAGADVVVIRDSPTAGDRLGPDCVLLSGDRSGGCTGPTTEVLPPDPMVEAVALFAHPAVHSIDLTDGFCLNDTCSGVIGGLPVFYDADHLSRSYAETLTPLLGARLEEVLRERLSAPR